MSYTSANSAQSFSAVRVQHLARVQMVHGKTIRIQERKIVYDA